MSKITNVHFFQINCILIMICNTLSGTMVKLTKIWRLLNYAQILTHAQDYKILSVDSSNTRGNLKAFCN